MDWAPVNKLRDHIPNQSKLLMDLGLKDKVIIVTGGAKGIGQAIAEVLAKEGAVPFIVGRKEADNLKAVRSIEAAGGKAFQVVAELTHPDECKKQLPQFSKGSGRIDGIVNNAGVNDGVNLENGSYEEFIESLHKNLIHYYLIAHIALPELKNQKVR